MDRTELRAGGGFQGNYGILSLVGGKQAAAAQFALHDAYTTLDQPYYLASLPTVAVKSRRKQLSPRLTPRSAHSTHGFWPGAAQRRLVVAVFRNNSWCWNWGLRDAIFPHFPTNARSAMAIVQATPNVVPGNAPLQGVIAFTPEVIADVLRVTGPITLSRYPQDPPVQRTTLSFRFTATSSGIDIPSALRMRRRTGRTANSTRRCSLRQCSRRSSRCTGRN